MCFKATKDILSPPPMWRLGARNQCPNGIMDGKLDGKKEILPSWPAAAPGVQNIQWRQIFLLRLGATTTSPLILVWMVTSDRWQSRVPKWHMDGEKKV
ncbi:hypothetical protein ElyMa_005219300 [Elysia marginata]|uniref:Uncharacterized protein n=1 Tax=Elysia marginata TaxID=1093978 RepID=A0AAV4JV68_9GAST|nr:hypothetical protein ElyMa_005219300 [Elysia marginata]